MLRARSAVLAILAACLVMPQAAAAFRADLPLGTPFSALRLDVPGLRGWHVLADDDPDAVVDRAGVVLVGPGGATALARLRTPGDPTVRRLPTRPALRASVKRDARLANGRSCGGRCVLVVQAGRPASVIGVRRGRALLVVIGQADARLPDVALLTVTAALASRPADALLTRIARTGVLHLATGIDGLEQRAAAPSVPLDARAELLALQAGGSAEIRLLRTTATTDLPGLETAEQRTVSTPAGDATWTVSPLGAVQLAELHLAGGTRYSRDPDRGCFVRDRAAYAGLPVSLIGRLRALTRTWGMRVFAPADAPEPAGAVILGAEAPRLGGTTDVAAIRDAAHRLLELDVTQPWSQRRSIASSRWTLRYDDALVLPGAPGSAAICAA